MAAPTACEDDDLDAVQLLIVQAVEKHPELYDKASPDYKKRTQKIKLWDRLAKELNIPGKIVSCRSKLHKKQVKQTVSVVIIY